ncbi:methyltransferase domain-containing protein [Bradyrhizobium sp. Arg314]
MNIGVDRRQVALSPLNMTGRGIEIAPYFNPFLDKSQYNVVYTDYVSTEELRAKAASNPGAVSRAVPEIDFVWKPGCRLKECMGDNNESFDFAVASHVVEHVPNTIGWLNDILEVMKVGAKLALMVPNRMDSFDFYRRETTVSDLIGTFVERRDIPTPSQVFDFMSRSVEDTGLRPKTFGEGYEFDSVKRSYTDDDALRTTISTYSNHAYLDVHCTVWTDQSFVKAFRHIASLGVMNVDVSDAVKTAPSEFIVHLTKLGEPTIYAPDPDRTIDDLQNDLDSARNAFAECNQRYEMLWNSRWMKTGRALRTLFR